MFRISRPAPGKGADRFNSEWVYLLLSRDHLKLQFRAIGLQVPTLGAEHLIAVRATPLNNAEYPNIINFKIAN